MNARTGVLLLALAAVALAADNGGQAETIPAALKGFRGMMSGKLLKKGEKTLVFKVEEVMKVWEGNRAKEPAKAVGQTLVLSLEKLDGGHGGRVLTNYRGLKVGDAIELEAFDLGGKTLCVQEWLRKRED